MLTARNEQDWMKEIELQPRTTLAQAVNGERGRHLLPAPGSASEGTRPSRAAAIRTGLVVLAFAAVAVGPAQAQYSLVHNTFGRPAAAVSPGWAAQFFHTGPSATEDYVVTEIVFWIEDIPLNFLDPGTQVVSLAERTADNAVAHFSNPAQFVEHTVTTFRAPGNGVRLKPDTPYWIVIDDKGATLPFLTTTSHEERGVIGWEIGNLRHTRRERFDTPYRVEIRGPHPGRIPSPNPTDATLSALELRRSGAGIPLEPAFSSERSSYSATVSDPELNLTIRMSDPGANVVAYLTQESNDPDVVPAPREQVANFRAGYGEPVALSLDRAGFYWLSVTVTSQDRSNVKRYRLRVLFRGPRPRLLTAVMGPPFNAVTLRYDKVLRPDGREPHNPRASPASAFSVMAAGISVPVRNTQINGEFVSLRLDRALGPEENQVTVSYPPPATNPVQTTIGGLAVALTDYPVYVGRTPLTASAL